MVSETNPSKVLFAESKCLGAFVHFWRRRVEIEKTYLVALSGLRIPDQPVNGQLQELAQKTRELLTDEVEERRRGLDKLQASYKALSNEFWTKEGPSHFDQWGKTMEMSLWRIDGSTAEVATAESIAERLAAEAREKNSPMSSSAKRKSQPLTNVLTRLLSTRNERPHDTSIFLRADSAYRQKVQTLNDEKYIIQDEIVPQTVRYVEHDRKCIVALRHIVSTFAAVHSDLAQVLNVTSSQLCNVSSSVDALVESTSFSERLDESLTSLIQPYRYTSYEVSSTFRPTTMIFGCPLPEELRGASIGQRAVSNAFEMILSSAAKRHPTSLYKAICDAYKQQGDDTNLSALQLESLWDSSQRNGGSEAIDYLAKAPSDRLLVYFLIRLPTPFLPFHDTDIKKLAKVEPYVHGQDMKNIFTKAGNRMGTARRCHLARLLLTLRRHEQDLWSWTSSDTEGIQILIRNPELFPSSLVFHQFESAVQSTDFVNGSFEDSLRLPDDFIEELKHADLLK